MIQIAQFGIVVCVDVDMTIANNKYSKPMEMKLLNEKKRGKNEYPKQK